jgi:hypothetical protein
MTLDRVAARRGIPWRVIAAVAVAGALGAAASAVWAMPPPEDGGTVSPCSYSGNTGPLLGPFRVSTNGTCLSRYTAFWAYKTEAQGDPYRATVYHYNRDTGEYTQRFEGSGLLNADWVYSDAWGYNEVRFSTMELTENNTEWQIVQYM